MTNNEDLFKLFSQIFEQFLLNPDHIYTKHELLKNGQNDELIEILKTKFLGKFIDPQIVATPEISGAKTITELLLELETALEEKNISLYKDDNGKFYHSDTLIWFPDAIVQGTLLQMLVTTLPKGGMTEGEMIAEAESLKKTYQHQLADYLRTVIFLVKNNFFAKKNKWVLGFLLEKYQNVPRKFYCGRDSFGKFYLVVNDVRSGRRRDGETSSLLLSNWDFGSIAL